MALFDSLGNLFPLIRTIAIIVVIYLIFNFILTAIKKNLLKKAKSKKQISNVEIFARILKYVFFMVIVLIGIFSYSVSLTGLGIGLGLFSAALGWALQKPITGLAAWIMIVTKRPFSIGDRILIGGIKGDVSDITLTHIYIQEIGGLVVGEETSGRIIMVPNSTLFEQNIINYTLQNEYVLDQVVVSITYESDLDKAMLIAKEAAKKHTKDFIDKTKKKPYIRTFFHANGINVHARYFAPASRLQEFSSKITKEIYDQIMKTKGVEFAYPHTEVIYRKKENA